MVDYPVNKPSQGIAIARPAARPPPKVSGSGFTVQQTKRVADHHNQTTLSRHVPDPPPSFRGVEQRGSTPTDMFDDRVVPSVASPIDPSSRNFMQLQPKHSGGREREDFLPSIQSSAFGSDRDFDRMVAVEQKASAPTSPNTNFSPLIPSSSTDVNNGPNGQKRDLSSSDPGVGPSYQRHQTSLMPAKNISSLSGKKGAALKQRTDLTVGKGRFILKKQIGAGSFGEIFWGIDTVTNKEVAIKLESIKVRHPQLQYESRIYKLLHSKDNFHPSITRYNMHTFHTTNKIIPTRGGGWVDQRVSGQNSGSNQGSPRNMTTASTTFQELREVIGFPQCYFYGTEGEYNVMVMDLLGPNLEDLFNYCHRKFSLKTVCLLADQMLHRIEYLHSKGFIHRDLKPENFVMGGDPERSHVLYLIDYGLSKRYLDSRTHVHVTYKEGKSLTGTARYCSINAHLGIEQSRRDDIEALGYIILYFLKRGFLPWQGIRGAQDPQTKNVRISEKKINTRPEALCRDEPPQILNFLTYARGLKFEETPDYVSCREFFASLVDRHNWDRDFVFDWVTRRAEERMREQHQANHFLLDDRSLGYPKPQIGDGVSDIDRSQLDPSLTHVTIASTIDEDNVHHNYNYYGKTAEPVRSNKVHLQQPTGLPDMELML